MLTNEHRVGLLIAKRLHKMVFRFHPCALVAVRHADGKRVYDSCLRAALRAMRAQQTCAMEKDNAIQC